MARSQALVKESFTNFQKRTFLKHKKKNVFKTAVDDFCEAISSIFQFNNCPDIHLFGLLNPGAPAQRV